MRTTPTWRQAPSRVAVAALVMLLASGCSSVADRATERVIETAARGSGMDVDIDSSGERITIESEDGSMSIGSGQLPDALRDAFALPGDLEVTSDTTMTEGTNTLYGITGFVPRTDDAALIAELTAAMTAAGWTITMDYGAGDGIRVFAAEREGEFLNVAVTPAQSGTGLDLAINLTRSAE
jgi:hypothetical protein